MEEEKKADAAHNQLAVPRHSILEQRIIGDQSTHDVISGFVCSFCYNLPKHPVQCDKCEKVACKECYEEWNQPNECPMKCHKPKYNKVNKSTNNVFTSLKINCMNKIRGCRQSPLHGDLEKHELDCDYQLIQCRAFPGCKIHDVKHIIVLHEGLCGFVQVECVHCKIKIKRNEEKAHDDICNKKPIKCKDCKSVKLREEMAAHDANCDEKVVKCDSCEFSMKRKEFKIHSCVELLKAKNKELNEKLLKALEEVKEFKQAAQLKKCAICNKKSDLRSILSLFEDKHFLHSECLEAQYKAKKKQIKCFDDIKCPKCEKPIEFNILEEALGSKRIEKLTLKMIESGCFEDSSRSSKTSK